MVQVQEIKSLCACSVAQTLKSYHGHESVTPPYLPFGDEEDGKRNGFVFCAEGSLWNHALLVPAPN